MANKIEYDLEYAGGSVPIITIDYDLHKSFARNTHQYGAMRYFRIIGIVENGCFLLKQETAFLSPSPLHPAALVRQVSLLPDLLPYAHGHHMILFYMRAYRVASQPLMQAPGQARVSWQSL